MSTIGPDPTSESSNNVVRQENGAGEASPPNCTINSSLSVENIEQFLCPICMDPMIKPTSTSCGHKFCLFCLATWFNQRGRKNCPTCRSIINEVSSLTLMEEKIEHIIAEQYTPEQLNERLEQKLFRESSEVIQKLGSNPLETMMVQQYQDNELDYELNNLFQFDEEFLNSWNVEVIEDDIEPPVQEVHITATIITEDSRLQEHYERTVLRMRLDRVFEDFEINLRQSQMSFRSLMDELTQQDPDGHLFPIVQERLRSLGLRPQHGRLISSFPADDIPTIGQSLNLNRQNGSINHPYQRQIHPSDYYFTHLANQFNGQENWGINRSTNESNRNYASTFEVDTSRAHWNNPYFHYPQTYGSNINQYQHRATETVQSNEFRADIAQSSRFNDIDLVSHYWALRNPHQHISYQTQNYNTNNHNITHFHTCEFTNSQLNADQSQRFVSEEGNVELLENNIRRARIPENLPVLPTSERIVEIMQIEPTESLQSSDGSSPNPIQLDQSNNSERERMEVRFNPIVFETEVSIQESSTASDSNSDS